MQQSSIHLRVLHPTMSSYPTLTVGCAAPSSDFQIPSAWNFRANATKQAFVHHLISCFVLVPLILTPPCLHRTMPLRGGPCVHLLSWLLVHLSLQSVFPVRRRDIRTVELYVFLPKRGTAVTPLCATAVPHPTWSKHTSHSTTSVSISCSCTSIWPCLSSVSSILGIFMHMQIVYCSGVASQPPATLQEWDLRHHFLSAIFHSPVRYRYRSTPPTNEKRDRLI